MREVLQDLQRQAVTGGIMITALFAGMASTADATGNACPAPSRLRSVSPACRTFLLGELRDSVFDDVSDQLAVITYQKLAPEGLAVDGDLGPNTAKSILKGDGLHIASPDPNSDVKEMYVDKRTQTMASVTKGRLNHIFSVSTGTEQPYQTRDKDGNKLSGIADTPTGVKTIKAVYGKGYRAPLGAMPYARFFDLKQGIAVHSGVVDADGRDSHGCARVDNATMEKFIVKQYGIGRYVKVIENANYPTSFSTGN